MSIPDKKVKSRVLVFKLKDKGSKRNYMKEVFFELVVCIFTFYYKIYIRSHVT